ncbi:carbohydrate ABC transporter permease [Paenibacillus hexagrammi]|uniref:Sugar ABC transporter permease n=1 Tax=Paenibacillus hexagrammi TaxID=2908839 RepID=A0ABY3SGN4_9BACL|nr:sugar ABC transporter permease [Paenibacillus sp. YPD9-1]UJF32638.1 sugar ABC transporter permease [Paenibacillus sp. YPD9-1]
MNKKTTVNRWSTASLPYLFITPALLMIASFLFYPIANVFYYSFQTYNMSKPYYNGFAGLQNFVKVFTDDPMFYSSLWISVKWVFVQVCLQLVFGLLVALLLNQSFRVRWLFRTAAFLPWAISGVIASLIWSNMLNENIGIINHLLMAAGLIHNKIAWTANVHTVFGSVVIAEFWRGLPFFSITLLASLQTIPGELYESAKVDGAGRWKSFTHVTLPYLKNTIILTTLLRTAWEFNNIDLIFNLTGGGPAHATTTLTLYVAQLAVKSGDFGYGSAITVVTFCLLLIFSVVYLKISRFGKDDSQ